MTQNPGNRTTDVQNEEDLIYKEQIKLLYKNSTPSLIAGLLNSIILVSMLWNVVPHERLIGWIFAIILITCVRLYFVYRFRTFREKNSWTPQDYSRWDDSFSLGIALGSIVWGLSVIILYPAQSFAHQVFLTFVLGGMIAGSVAGYSSRMRAFLSFSLPILILVTFRFFMEFNTIHTAMGIMMLVFAFVMITSAHYMNAFAISNIKLKIEKDRIGKELKEKSELYLDLFNNASDMIQSVDKDGSFIYVNRAWKENLGYNNTDIAGLKIFDIISPEYREHYADLFKDVMKGKKRDDVETVFIAKSGERIIVEGNIDFRIEDDTSVSTRAIFRNITDRKRDEAELKEGAARIGAILDTATDAIISIDHTGIIKNYNRAAEKIFGYSVDEAMGKSVNLLMPEPYRSNHDRFIQIYLDTGQKKVIGIGRETLGIRKDGTQFPLDLAISEVRTNGKRIFTGIARDITQRKKDEEALRYAMEEAHNANRVKSEFLASMSHEIRTPMNAIIGIAELLYETPLSKEQKEYVRIFRSAGENLLNIINDILDISKIEAGKIELEEREFDLREIIDGICEIMAIRSHEKNLELACDIPADIETSLIGDPIRLRQIIVNLIGNAVKFTNEGEIILSVRTVESFNIIKDEQKNSADKGTDPAASIITLAFSVKDSGIGIPEDKLPDIFESFSQADSSTTRKYGGTGLGLAISKRLVELMGGSIRVKSQEGSGTTFTFTADFMLNTKKQVDAKSHNIPDSIKGLRTLIIDDNATNLLILKKTLAYWGAVADTVGNGKSALEQLRQAHEKGEPYQLILLDGCMPEMDGFQVSEKIRDMGYLTEMPIMMLTSDNRKEDLKKVKDYGINMYLTKPVKMADLKELIMSVIAGKVKHQETLEQQKPEGDIKEKALKILLVDDSKDNRLLINAYLKKTDHNIDMAENGQEAIEKFMSAGYDLVLMDVQMPVMDGYTATSEIRNWEREKGLDKTTIIALTAHAMKEDEQKSYDAGCDAHLTKPIKKAKLLETINVFAGKG